MIAIVADLVWQVLNKVAAERHVQHLRASTDAEKWEFGGECCADQRVFEGVAIFTGRTGLLMCGLAVATRVDVGTACDDQPVERGDDPRRRGIIHGLWRKHEHGTAGIGHGANVHLGQKRRSHVPHAALRLFQVARNADERAILARTASLGSRTGPRKLRVVQSPVPSPNR